MTTPDAVAWFVSQPMASLTNPLTRAALTQLLSDPVNALALLITYFPLRTATWIEVTAFQTVTTDYTDILSRLRIQWTNDLELAYLGSVVDDLEPSYSEVITGLAPLLWYQMQDTATPAVNSGSLGSGLNAAVANATFESAGLNVLIPKSITWNGTTTTFTIPANAGLNATEWTFAILLNPVNAGGTGGAGYFFDTQTAANDAVANFNFNGALTSLAGTMRNTAGGSNSLVITATAGITAGVWVWLFLQFKDVDRKLYAWKNNGANLLEFTYNSQTALADTPRAIGKGFVGQRSTGANTQNARFAQFMYFDKLLTPVQMQSIITASRVAA